MFIRQVVYCAPRWVIVVVYLLCIYSLFCFLCKVWENIVQNLERDYILLGLRLHFSIFTDKLKKKLVKKDNVLVSLWWHCQGNQVQGNWKNLLQLGSEDLFISKIISSTIERSLYMYGVHDVGKILFQV